jgi:hypothetical protein
MKIIKWTGGKFSIYRLDLGDGMECVISWSSERKRKGWCISACGKSWPTIEYVDLETAKKKALMLARMFCSNLKKSLERVEK